jgi:hypothetical protein
MQTTPTHQLLQSLANETSSPCVTISLNTHRTHPANTNDAVVLKNLLHEAENRIIEAYGKRPVADLLEKLASVTDEIDIQYNLDSLHIFLSNETREIIRLAWPVEQDMVHIADSFAVRALIMAANRDESYLIMLMSQSGVQLMEAMNDTVVAEIKNDHFPFSENQHYVTGADKRSDAKHADDQVREFLNKVDKALVQVHQQTGLHCIVISTEDNYNRLMQVADLPSVYIGHALIDYNQHAQHVIAAQAWDIMIERQHQRRTEAIAEMQEAVSKGNVLTDLQEIYQAAIDGNGDMLIIHQQYAQAVCMTSERTFDLVDDATAAGVIDDICSKIAWEVYAKKGRVFFTGQDQIKDLGMIVLKKRY